MSLTDFLNPSAISFWPSRRSCAMLISSRVVGLSRRLNRLAISLLHKGFAVGANGFLHVRLGQGSHDQPGRGSAPATGLARWIGDLGGRTDAGPERLDVLGSGFAVIASQC